MTARFNLIAAAALLALGLASMPAAASVAGFPGSLADTAPRSVFDDLSGSAPRSPFDAMADAAPRSVLDEIQDAAPRGGPFGSISESAP